MNYRFFVFLFLFILNNSTPVHSTPVPGNNPFGFDYISNTADHGKFIVMKHKLYGMVDSTGKLVVPLQYTYLGVDIDIGDVNFLSGLCLACRDNHWGFLDTTGKEYIPCIYDTLGDGEYGRIDFYYPNKEACLNGKWGIINRHGQTVIPFQYQKVWLLDSNLFALKQNGLWYLADKNGPQPGAPGLEGIEDHDGKRIIVKKGRQYGICDRSGRMITSTLYDSLSLQNINGVYLLFGSKNGWWALLSPGGAPLQLFRYDYPLSITCFRTVMIKEKLNGLWGVVDSNGKTVIPFLYDNIEAGYSDRWQDTLTAVCKNGAWGAVSPKGREVIPCRYKSVSILPYGQIVVKQDDKVALFSQAGTALTAFRYDFINVPDSLLVLAHRDGLYYLLRANGAEMNTVGYNYMESVNHALVLSTDSIHFDLYNSAQQRLWNGSLNGVMPLFYSWLGIREQKLWMVFSPGLKRHTGFEMDSLDTFNDTLIKVKWQGQWLMMDTSLRMFHSANVYMDWSFANDTLGVCYLVKKENNKCALFNLNNQNLSGYLYNEINLSDHRGAPACARTDTGWVLLSRDGKPVGDNHYEEMYTFRCGLHIARLKNKWGFIDGQGKPVVVTGM